MSFTSRSRETISPVITSVATYGPVCTPACQVRLPVLEFGDLLEVDLEIERVF